MKELKVIPFGKYKGQPIEAVKSDAQYFEWLSNQDWFREKYSNMYNIIINNFTQPTDTPEHNSMQVKFLNKEYISKIVNHKWKNLLTDSYDQKLGLKFINKNSTIENVQFERGGWDVSFDLTIKGNPLFKINDENCLFGKPIIIKRWDDPIRISRYDEFKEKRIVDEFEYDEAKQIEVHYSNVRIELKPCIGDDFPSVLRQITSKKSGRYLRKVLFYINYTGVGATEDEFKGIFNASNIIVIKESEVI